MSGPTNIAYSLEKYDLVISETLHSSSTTTLNDNDRSRKVLEFTKEILRKLKDASMEILPLDDLNKKIFEIRQNSEPNEMEDKIYSLLMQNNNDTIRVRIASVRVNGGSNLSKNNRVNKKYINLQSGGKRLIHTGSKGGKYYIKGGKKVYLK